MTKQYLDWLNQGSYYQRDNGQKIFCRHSDGEGQDILFLHGFPTSSFDWAAVFDKLEAGKFKLSRDEAAELWKGVAKNDGQKISHRLLNYVAERKANGDVWEAAMEKSDIPQVLVWGMKDPVSGKHVLDYAKTNLKGAQMIELNDVAHYPQIEAPDLVSQSILQAI